MKILEFLNKKKKKKDFDFTHLLINHSIVCNSKKPIFYFSLILNKQRSLISCWFLILYSSIAFSNKDPDKSIQKSRKPRKKKWKIIGITTRTIPIHLINVVIPWIKDRKTHGLTTITPNLINALQPNLNNYPFHSAKLTPL